MTLARTTIQKPGSRAWFTSRDFRLMPPATQSNTGPKCLSFWQVDFTCLLKALGDKLNNFYDTLSRYIMNEPFIDASGPSLGALTVYTRSASERDSTGNLVMKPQWRLYNHQGPDWLYAQALINDPNDSVSILLSLKVNMEAYKGCLQENTNERVGLHQESYL